MQMLLKQALSAAPVEITTDDFDELSALDELAKGCVAPKPSDLTFAVLDHCLEVGGIKFQALTIAGRIWARDVGLPATAADPILQSLVIPFAMANRNLICDLHDHGKVRRAVRRWARWKCRKITEEGLLYMLRWFGMISDDTANQDEATPDQYGALLALLVKEYGSTPKFWLYEAHIEVVKACLNDVALKNYYEYESIRREAAKGGKAIAPDPNSPQVQSYTQFIQRLRVFQERQVIPHG